MIVFSSIEFKRRILEAYYLFCNRMERLIYRVVLVIVCVVVLGEMIDIIFPCVNYQAEFYNFK